VFLDDDILVEPGYLTHLIQAHDMLENGIVAGTWDLRVAETARDSRTAEILLASGAYYARAPIAPDTGNGADDRSTVTEVPFGDVHSNNMSLKREAYFGIGMMQALGFSGSSMWCDLDFNYRAYGQGYEFRRSTQAVCWHRDRSAANLDEFKQRERTAAYRSVVLFQKHPRLLAHVPMFLDKTPVNWRQDQPRLIARKLARALTASRLVLWSMEQFVRALEKSSPASSLLPALYRYIVGAYVFQGYRQGLGEFGPIHAVNEPNPVL
jgi:GT2 family glycosyltransferase